MKKHKLSKRIASVVLVLAMIASTFYGFVLPAKAAHKHTDACYPGTRHVHTESCRRPDIIRKRIDFYYSDLKTVTPITNRIYQCPGTIVSYYSSDTYEDENGEYIGGWSKTEYYCNKCNTDYGYYESGYDPTYGSWEYDNTIEGYQYGSRCTKIFDEPDQGTMYYQYDFTFTAAYTGSYSFYVNQFWNKNATYPDFFSINGTTIYTNGEGYSLDSAITSNLAYAGRNYKLQKTLTIQTVQGQEYTIPLRVQVSVKNVQRNNGYSGRYEAKRDWNVTPNGPLGRFEIILHPDNLPQNTGNGPQFGVSFFNCNTSWVLSGERIGYTSRYFSNTYDGDIHWYAECPPCWQCNFFGYVTCNSCFGTNIAPDLVWTACDECLGKSKTGEIFACSGTITSKTTTAWGYFAWDDVNNKRIPYDPTKLDENGNPDPEYQLPEDFTGQAGFGEYYTIDHYCAACEKSYGSYTTSSGYSYDYEGGDIAGGGSNDDTSDSIQKAIGETCGALYMEHCSLCHGNRPSNVSVYYSFYTGTSIAKNESAGAIVCGTPTYNPYSGYGLESGAIPPEYTYGFLGYHYICGKKTNLYYDSNGNVVSPACDKVVTSLVVQAPNQTINYSEPLSINLTATATFLNGTTKIVTCGTEGLSLDESAFNKSQSIYFTYGEYSGTAKNKNPYRVAGSIFINGFFSLVVSPNNPIRGSCEIVSAWWNDARTLVRTAANVSLKATPAVGYYLDYWLIDSTQFPSESERATYTEENHKALENYSFTMPPQNLNITAIFEPITYTVTFDVCANKVMVPDPQPVVFNTAYGDISGLPAPTRRGYTFRGWYDEAPKDGVANGNLIEDTTIHQIPNDITLYAYWTPNQYDINFNTNTGDPITETKTVTFDAEYGDLPIPTKEGFEFVEWVVGTYSVYGEIVGDRFVSNAIVSQPFDHTLVAKWRGEGYYVTLDPGEGTLTQSIYQVHPLEPYGNLPIPTRDMYKFVGWQMDDGNYAEPDTIVTRMSTHTLTAVWDYRPTSKMVRYDDEYGLLPEPIHIGYEFLCWWSDKDAANVTFGTRIASSNIVKTPRDHTIHAEWKPRDYRIEFDSNGGTPCAGITVTHGQPYKELPVPEKEGFAFTGWYFVEFNDNGYGTPIDVGSHIVRFSNNNAVQTLYAGWAEKESIAPIQVSFYTRTSEQFDPIMVEYDEPYGPLPTPTKLNESWEFLGWSYNYHKITEDSIVSIAYDHTLVADWTLDVVLDNRHGEPKFGPTVTMVYGQYAINVPIPTKEGYTFRGYYTDVRGNGTRYYDENGICVHICEESVMDKATLYAFWVQNPVITPTEPPVPEVTPKPTCAPVRLRIEADTPTAVITSDDGYNTQTGIPSTERVQIANNASEYHFDGVVREVSGTTKIAIQVKVPYVSIWEDYDTEEIYHKADMYGEKTITVHVPRDYVFWQVDSANVQKLTGLAITSDLVDTGKASFAYDGALKTTKYIDYTLEEHVTDPNLVLDYSNYFDKPVKAISETPGTPLTEEEIIALLTIHAKGIAYEDPTQMNVKSDYLIVDGNVLLSFHMIPLWILWM